MPGTGQKKIIEQLKKEFTSAEKLKSMSGLAASTVNIILKYKLPNKGFKIVKNEKNEYKIEA